MASGSGSSYPWLDALNSIDKLTSLSLSGWVLCCSVLTAWAASRHIIFQLSIDTLQHSAFFSWYHPPCTWTTFILKRLSVKHSSLMEMFKGIILEIVSNKALLQFLLQDIDWVQTEKHVFEQASNHPFLVGLHSCFQTESRWDVSDRNIENLLVILSGVVLKISYFSSVYRLFFVIEYVNGGDLMFHMQRQRKLPEEHAR